MPPMTAATQCSSPAPKRHISPTKSSEIDAGPELHSCTMDVAMCFKAGTSPSTSLQTTQSRFEHAPQESVCMSTTGQQETRNGMNMMKGSLLLEMTAISDEKQDPPENAQRHACCQGNRTGHTVQGIDGASYRTGPLPAAECTSWHWWQYLLR